MGELRPPKLSRDELDQLLRREFPQIFEGAAYTIDAVRHGGSSVRWHYDPLALRPGGTISGPTMMELADFATFVAILATVGWVPLAVTTNLNINFLRKPAPCGLLAEATILKLGKRLAVLEVGMRSDGEAELVAHATATYSIPSR
jgi:uncharacterized protein (TIGR00369 family)